MSDSLLYIFRNGLLYSLTVFLISSCVTGASGKDDKELPASGPFASGNRKNLLFESTFEGNDFLKGWHNDQHCCDYSVMSSAKSRVGSGSVKFDLYSTDEAVSGSVRSEINLDAEPMNCERWYGMSFYLADYGFDEGAETIIQWHHVANISTGSPPLGLQVNKGRLNVVSSIGETNNYDGDIGEVVPDTWIDIVFHIRWTDSATGFIEVWRDGVKKLSRRDVVTNTSESYVKLGINKWSWMHGEVSVQKHRTLFADEFRIGNENAGYDDVKPGK